MAYRRKKSASAGLSEAVEGIRKRFSNIKLPVKLAIFLLPLTVAAVLVIVFAIPGIDPVLQASTTDPPAEVTNYVMPSPPSSQVPTTTPMATLDQTLKRGDENEEVKKLQERLMQLGYLDIDESTELFGPATEKAVEWFQREENLLDNAGLKQTGIADNDTQYWLFSEDARPYTLLENTEGPDVKKLQNQLIFMGYLKGRATGIYGQETTDAVKKFQKRNHLTADGKTGEDTLDKIYSPNAVADPSAAAYVKVKINVDQMINAAKKAKGKSYVSGAEGPNSFDCSGLIYYSLNAAGSKRGRYNAAGYAAVNDWPKITSMSKLKKGDLMFFWDSSKGKIGHVSIYIGGGKMIDASSSNGKVVERSATSSWCRSQFRWARRPWSTTN